MSVALDSKQGARGGGARLETWRCQECGRVLAKLALMPGSVLQVKCKCNACATLDLRPKYCVND